MAFVAVRGRAAEEFIAGLLFGRKLRFPCHDVVKLCREWIHLGRTLDLAAPLGRGQFGIIHGPHGSGLTRTLQAVARGVRRNAPDIHLIVLFLRPRGEEITEWRRGFPDADVVVCPSAQSNADPRDTLRAADLTLECAQRQTELGKHVLIAVDSLTGLWGAMLESEQADAQREADIALARRRIRDWVEKAGDFTGEGFLGSGLGGSLTIIGTAWSREIDIEAEEEGEMHPHLRLIEHVLSDSAWQVALSGELSAERLYPAVDLARCISRNEENLVPADRFELILAARRALLDLPLIPRFHRLEQALQESEDFDLLAGMLASTGPPRDSSIENLRNLLGGDS